MDDLEILEALKNNSTDKTIFEFTREIFYKELRGDHEWKSDYEKIVSDFVDEVVE